MRDLGPAGTGGKRRRSGIGEQVEYLRILHLAALPVNEFPVRRLLWENTYMLEAR